MNKPIRVFIADDNRLLREGLASMLEEIDDITVAGMATSGSQAIDQIKQLFPDAALVDIGMPDLTDEIMACIEAGAAGYVHKEASFEYLVESIQSVHR